MSTMAKRKILLGVGTSVGVRSSLLAQFTIVTSNIQDIDGIAPATLIIWDGMARAII